MCPHIPASVAPRTGGVSTVRGGLSGGRGRCPETTLGGCGSTVFLTATARTGALTALPASTATGGALAPPPAQQRPA